MATLTAIAAVPVVSVIAVGALRQPAALPPATGSVLPQAAYSTELRRPPPSDPEMAGRWRIDLRGGSLDVTAPASFTGTTTGFHYSTSGDVLRVDMFQQDLCSDLAVGVYRWRQEGNALRFSVVNDPCLPRATLLAGPIWEPAE